MIIRLIWWSLKIISICIIVTSASLQGANITNPSEIRGLLEPFYGNISNWIINLGFFCAGLTSSITAPIAAAIIFCECFNLKLNGFYYKLVSISVVLIGFIFSSIYKLPIQIILFAQVANGILLPVLGVLLFILINKKTYMKLGGHELVKKDLFEDTRLARIWSCLLYTSPSPRDS